MRKRMNQKGFTLIEIVVAIAVMLVIGAAATVLLLGHLNDAKTASVLDDTIKIKAALNSEIARAQGNLADTDGDGDYLDDMLDRGAIDRMPSSIPDTTWHLKAGTTGTQTVYFLEIACAEGSTQCLEAAAALDESMDGGDAGSAGSVQWSMGG